jgi:hypothetical protein
MARFNPLISQSPSPAPPPTSKPAAKPTPVKTPAKPVALTKSVRMEFNPAKNGIELYFAEKPDETVRAELKSAGWRWGFHSGCWYTKDNPAKRQ